MIMVIVNILAFRCGLVWIIIKRKTRIIIYMYLKQIDENKKNNYDDNNFNKP